ncbi:Nicastrin [Oopsacas minuta]|uniref:Nicastrin n=1 Tax=Oopsacas minuta TaxID=111878 RepID=A0AAV7KDR3_9METZ|nr:Nicastrin [Oopsacas minuta]
MHTVFLILTFTHLIFSSTVLDGYIYYKYDNDLLAPPCTRLVNATHQIGCSTGAYPKSGTLFELNTDSDFDFVMKPGPHSPYIVLIHLPHYAKDNILKLEASPYVAGILVDVINQPDGLDSFSPQTECPNMAGFQKNDCHLNPDGNSLDFYDFNEFPIFSINDQTILSNLQDCAKSNQYISGLSYVCSVQLTSRMYASVNTEVCTRRLDYVLPQFTSSTSYCSPLQGWSLWGTLFPLKENTNYNNTENGIILIAAQLDASAFFHDLSYGAEHDLSAIAVLLGIAEVLGKLKRNNSINDTGNPIVFAFFDGEEWQHIGSSKMAYDISKGKFPLFPDIELSHQGIKHFIGMDQVALPSNQSWYVHSTPSAQNDSEFISAFQSSSQLNNISFTFLDDGLNLPSTMTYFSHFNANISGAIITDFNDTFNNRFHGSFLDNAKNLGINTNPNLITDLQILCKSLTESILSISNIKVDEAIDKSCNESLLTQILDCFLVNSSCPLFSKVSPPDLPASSGPVSRYVSIQTTTSLTSLITHNLLAYFIGDREITVSKNCSVNISPTSKSLYRTYFSQGPNYNSSTMLGVCVNSTVYFYKAISPSVELNSFGSNSIYSTWAESTWEEPSIWIYLAANNYIYYGEFMLGFAMTLVTLIVSIIFTVKASMIFK